MVWGVDSTKLPQDGVHVGSCEHGIKIVGFNNGPKELSVFKEDTAV